MIFITDKKNSNIFTHIDFSELKQQPKISVVGQKVTVEISDDERRLFFILINEGIVQDGMDDQNTVNDLGLQIYDVYYEFLEQNRE